MILEATQLRRSYRLGARLVEAVRGVSLAIDRGETVAVVGKSGSGKSTLLHLCGGLDRPDGGQVRLDGKDLGSLPDGALSALRRRRLGFVFQAFHLVPTLDALENVALPLLLDGERAGRAAERARALLAAVGLEGRASHRPAELSGGELQRVAIARALVAEPALVLADEPTGNLDSESGAQVLELLRRAVTERQVALLLVTHDARAASTVGRVVTLHDGQVVADEPRAERSAGLAEAVA